MNLEKINRIIHEARGYCWHEPEERDNGWIVDSFCPKCCQFSVYVPTINYTTDWSDYGPMLEWAMKQVWWHDFVYMNRIVDIDYNLVRYFLSDKIFRPLYGSTAIAEFLEKRN